MIVSDLEEVIISKTSVVVSGMDQHMIDGLLPPGILDYISQVSSDEHLELTHIRVQAKDLKLKTEMMIGPHVSNFLQILLKISCAKTCLEVGTYTGYSALSFAWALPEDGMVISLERDQFHANLAKANFENSKVGHKIQLITGDASQTLRKIDKVFDFIFIDADKKNYPVYFDLTLPLLKKNGLMIVDNALYKGDALHLATSQGRAIHEMNYKAKYTPGIETQLLSIRDGILLVRKC